jgi:hypothetical protein
MRRCGSDLERGATAQLSGIKSREVRKELQAKVERVYTRKRQLKQPGLQHVQDKPISRDHEGAAAQRV